MHTAVRYKHVISFVSPVGAGLHLILLNHASRANMSGNIWQIFVAIVDVNLNIHSYILK